MLSHVTWVVILPATEGLLYGDTCALQNPRTHRLELHVCHAPSFRRCPYKFLVFCDSNSHTEAKRYPKHALIATACALLTLSTAEMIVNILRICEGFLNIDPTQSLNFFNSVSEPTFVIKSCLFNAQTLILDAVVIYRTWVVWQNSLRVILFPLIGWFGLLACSIGNNIALATASENPGDVFATQTGQWITSVYSMTLVTNLSATSLLAYRIWTINRETSNYRMTDRLSPVLRVVIESGAIYSLTIIAAIITFAIQSPGVYVLLDMISPIISIVFNMIIIRVGIASKRILSGNSAQDSNIVPSSPRSERGVAPFHLGWLRESGAHEMKSLAVEITQYRETDTEGGSLAGPGDVSSEMSSRKVKLAVETV